MAPMALIPDYFHTWRRFRPIAAPSPRLQPIKSVPWCLRILVWPLLTS